jgi:hypothetical protein
LEHSLAGDCTVQDSQFATSKAFGQRLKIATPRHGRIPVFGGTKVQGIIDQFPLSTRLANSSAGAWRRRKRGDGGLPIDWGRILCFRSGFLLIYFLVQFGAIWCNLV